MHYTVLMVLAQAIYAISVYKLLQKGGSDELPEFENSDVKTEEAF
jgi:hypothetical protein